MFGGIYFGQYWPLYGLAPATPSFPWLHDDAARGIRTISNGAAAYAGSNDATVHYDGGA